MGWYLFGWVFATILCLLYKVELLSSLTLYFAF